MAKDMKIAMVLLLAGLTLASSALLTLWFRGVILAGLGVPARDASRIWIATVAATTLCALYVMRPLSWQRNALLVFLYVGAMFIGGGMIGLLTMAINGDGP